ncbi:AMP-binding protein [Emcibacter sp.]|uniref:AMP-binding protein n=1 Tax=Emcibacter sp. TaxID=1979954 RepID=UPI002AA6272E|nr:AMP-binding protein [Emcibacter sp.]
MSANLYELIQQRMQGKTDRPAIVTPEGGLWTYGDLDDLSARFAGLLRRYGVTPGARVVMQVDKSVGAVALYLGCLRAGAIFIPLNTSYTAEEVDYFLKDARPQIFVCRPEGEEAAEKLAADACVPFLKLMGTSPENCFWAEALATDPDPDIEDYEEDDLAAILYTSGTTGKPKGAMLSHGNLSSNALTLLDYWAFEDGDVLLHALPVFHVHGLFVALHTAFLNVSKVIFLEKYEVGLIRKYLPESTILMGVPTFYTRLLAEEDFGKEDCANMRLFISGSAPMTAQVHREFEARTGHRILERYGMTEAGMITSNPYDGERIAGTVGFALPGIEVRIADEEGNLLPAGETGIVEARGPNIFQGYWQMPEKTSEEFRDDGFFITGDVGSLDDEARLTLEGRAKDLIISGGLNIYPKEIEACLDAIDGVKESAVIGVPDADFGEAVIAVVVPEVPETISEAALREVVSKKLARFKHPKSYHLVAELPRNTMGKVQKNILRQQYAN